MRWIFNAPIVESWLDQCIKESGVSRSVGHLLRQVPFKNEEEFHQFLRPSLQAVEVPELIENLQEAVHWVDDACRNHKRVAILSDYDVDGVTSMALMARCFHALGYSFEPYFPIREVEGYGLTERVVERILSTESHLDCLISLDCGTNSIEAVEQLRKQKIKVIIVDHHKRNRDYLPDAIIVNPHVNPEKHSQSAKELCTAGLVFKWLHVWLKKLKKEENEIAQNMRLKPFLDFVALGSIADLVPLRRENRLWVYYGLKEMLHSQSPGLLKLLEYSGCSQNIPLTVEDVAFKIAPRVNASGRLDSAELPYRLLTHSDSEFCRVAAQELNQLNTERRSTRLFHTFEEQRIVQF